MTPSILPGAEPFSAPGGPHGALLLHGFTGCPQSLRGLARAFADAGFAVELPLLPGHGTTVEDMAESGWPEWTSCVEATYQSLCRRCDKVVVAGLSLGGALTLWLAARHPEIAGIAVVNPVADVPEPSPVAALREQVEGGVKTIPGIAGDIADPDGQELAYESVPLVSLISMFEGLTELAPRLGDVRCPTLLLNSPQDHVVQPSQSDRIAGRVGGPVERVKLERSYHVATLDYDKDRIERSAVAFAQRVTSG